MFWSFGFVIYTVHHAIVCTVGVILEGVSNLCNICVFPVLFFLVFGVSSPFIIWSVMVQRKKCADICDLP